MKAFILIILTVLTMSSCAPGNGRSDQANRTVSPVPATPAATETGTREVKCEICDFDYAQYKGDLKKEEIEGLLLALNDEYQAWAIYDLVNKEFNDPRPFRNIQQAEAQHAARLKQVFRTYDLAVPENRWIGKAPKFKSVDEACQAGAQAEIANRDLYKRLFETTKRDDILVVYRALQKASEENHLPAFERCGAGPRSGRGRTL